MAVLIRRGAVRLAMGVDCGGSESARVPERRRKQRPAGLENRRFGYVQWGPADVQPLVLSPKAWMCMPRLALGSWPLMSQVMVVGADSDSCSKTTVPVTLESPRRTATSGRAHVSNDSPRFFASAVTVHARCRVGMPRATLGGPVDGRVPVKVAPEAQTHNPLLVGLYMYMCVFQPPSSAGTHSLNRGVPARWRGSN